MVTAAQAGRLGRGTQGDHAKAEGKAGRAPCDGSSPLWGVYCRSASIDEDLLDFYIPIMQLRVCHR
jgi:hypothetical protein